MTNMERVPTILGDNAPSDEGSSARSWVLAAGACAVALVILVALLRDTAFGIASHWRNSVAFNHGFAILPLAAYLVWRRRAQLAKLRPDPALAGVGLTALAALAWLFAKINDTPVVEGLALVALGQGIVLATFGAAVARTLAFPLVFLFFAVPTGDSLLPLLQDITAFIAVSLLKLSGVPVRTDGLLINVPGGRWEVAEACSGIRYLFASLALGTFLAGAFLRSWPRRLAFIGLSILIPIVANGVRAYGVIGIGYLANTPVAVAIDKLLYSWLFFAIIAALLAIPFVALRKGERAADSTTTPERRAQSGPSVHRLAVAVVVALALVAAVRSVAADIERPPVSALSVRALTLPEVSSWWRLPLALDRAPPRLAGADRDWRRVYHDGNDVAFLTIGYYAWERRGAQTVSSAHRFTFGNLEPDDKPLPVDASIGGSTISANVLAFPVPWRHRLLWYWYWVDGRFTGNPYLAKLLQLKVKLLGGHQAAAIVVVSTDYLGARASAEAILRRFTASLDVLGPSLAGLAAAAPATAERSTAP
jgi:exosortase A